MKSRMSSPRMSAHQSGRALVLLISGIVAGLAIAAIAAISITQAPVPFLNKVQKPSDMVQPSADGKLPDPNKSLYTTPPPTTDNSKGSAVVLQTEPTPLFKVPPPTSAPASAPEGESSRYLLQAGAYKAPDEADSMRARLALLGLDAKVYPVEQSGATLYRVRMGPYGQIDEVNKTRKLLADNQIEAQVVRIR